jgi:hypothetical protein
LLKFKDVPQEQRGEVVRMASALYDRESAEQRELTSTVAAAEELGIPQEYLERATQALQEKRATAARRSRTRLLVAGGIAAIGMGAFLLRPAPPAPPLTLSPTAVQPLLSANAGTRAIATTDGERFVLKVDRFAERQNRYSANLDLPLPKNALAGHREVTFTLQGTGTIPKVRLFLEGGSLNERWKGPDIALSDTPRAVTVPLDQFVRQQRVSDTTWKDIAGSKPSQATTFSIKSGAPINPSNVSGTIGISRIEFK